MENRENLCGSEQNQEQSLEWKEAQDSEQRAGEKPAFRDSQRPGSSRQKKAAVISDMTGFGRCPDCGHTGDLQAEGAVLSCAYGGFVQPHGVSQLLF